MYMSLQPYFLHDTQNFPPHITSHAIEGDLDAVVLMP
jgi:hypothetical protein